MKQYPVALSLEEGIACLLQEVSSKGTERIHTQEAFRRVLAEDIYAPEMVPPFARSPYDGYAFRAQDVAEASKEHPVTLEILEEIPAGHAPTCTVGAGQAVKILTGAPVPEGADAIEKFEVTEFTEKTVTIFSPLRSGDNVVPAGEDVSKGQLVLKKGIVLTAADCGILAALGVTDVLVYERVRISVISTGDELVQIEDALAPGKIRNSSAYTMEAFLTDWGHTVTRYGIVKDDVTAIAMAVKDVVATSDVVLTTGGVSVGDYDCLQDAMQQLDAKVLFWKLKMKPGSAFLASVYEGTPVISLSGNPGAAMIAMMLVAQPVLRKMAGRADVSLETIEVTLKDGFRKKSKMRRFLPGRLRIVDGQAVLDLTPTQGNGMLSPLHGCNLIGEIPMDSPAMEAGSRIRAYVMDSI